MAKIIESVAHEGQRFEPAETFRARALIRDFKDYQHLYGQSLADPAAFWGKMAQGLEWFEPWSRVCESSFKPPVAIRWFTAGKLNASVNCLDRHVRAGLGQRPALLWEGNDPGESRTVTYEQLLQMVCQLAHGLKELGVGRGDRVAIYMPMVPELAAALLACARIGAIHSVIFGGFSPESIKDRILDAGCKVLLTADGLKRGYKSVALKANCDAAMRLCEQAGHRLEKCLVLKRTGEPVTMVGGRDLWWHEFVAQMPTQCEPAVMDAEDPLFILYTSGSTGKPKGVLHTTGGYMVYAATTFKVVFDARPEDIFWCTADIGWVTGHSYIVYGPLANAATVLMYEGIPQHPDWGRFWQIIDKYKVTTFYTAPTAIRALAREGDDIPARYDLSSLRLLGSVGEPINPEAWLWYHKNIGRGRCPIVDTWWQTETGGILITTLPGAMAAKPGSAGFPFFGVKAKILREDGSECARGEGGMLVMTDSWPGMMSTVYGDHKRFEATYFARFPGSYFTGDGCHQDAEGYYWLMGRIDDVINVSGHRLGTAEVESALVSHPAVAEAAVVGYPHTIKGQGIYAYVTPKEGVAVDTTLRANLAAHVRQEIGPIATPDVIHFTNALPKTRSGKIMRRILRQIAAGQTQNLGDTTTLADPAVVESLLASQPVCR